MTCKSLQKYCFTGAPHEPRLTRTPYESTYKSPHTPGLTRAPAIQTYRNPQGSTCTRALKRVALAGALKKPDLQKTTKKQELHEDPRIQTCKTIKNHAYRHPRPQDAGPKHTYVHTKSWLQRTTCGTYVPSMVCGISNLKGRGGGGIRA